MASRPPVMHRILSASLALGFLVALLPVPAHALSASPAGHRAHPNVLVGPISRSGSARPAASPPGPAGGYIPCDVSRAYGLDKVPGDGAGLTIAVVDPFHWPSAPDDYQRFS